MSEVKNSNPSKKTIWLVVIAAAVLIAGIVFFNYDRLFSSKNTGPATSAATDGAGTKMPSAAKPGNTSGRGAMRSSGGLNAPQSLSGKSINGPQTMATGKVVDAAGKGVPDVRVQCKTCQTSAALALTDENGDFKLPYHFEPQGDINQMIILVSKGKQSSKHIIQPSSTIGLKLELK